MTDQGVVAGYVVTNQHAIWATGETADDAQALWETIARDQGLKLLSDEADSTQENGPWARASDFRVQPATAALLADVHNRGGNKAGWIVVDGVCCTGEEEKDASSDKD